MLPYDTNFVPPAIVLTVNVNGVVQNRPRIEISALIDTGADITAIPQEFVERLKLYPFGRLHLEDAHAVKTLVNTYEARLSLPGDTAKAMEVILTPFPFAILGRDWLQDYYLLLDGPGQQFQLNTTPLNSSAS